MADSLRRFTSRRNTHTRCSYCRFVIHAPRWVDAHVTEGTMGFYGVFFTDWTQWSVVPPEWMGGDEAPSNRERLVKTKFLRWVSVIPALWDESTAGKPRGCCSRSSCQPEMLGAFHLTHWVGNVRKCWMMHRVSNTEPNESSRLSPGRPRGAAVQALLPVFFITQ